MKGCIRRSLCPTMTQHDAKVAIMFYDYYETQLEKSNVIREVKREVQKKNRLRKFKADTIFQNLFLSATDF